MSVGTNDLGPAGGKRLVTLLGSGCASLSLASQAEKFPSHSFEVVEFTNYPNPIDHVWGFWSMPWLREPLNLARHCWYKWNIITRNENIVLETKTHPYCAIHMYKWMNYCKDKSRDSGVRFSFNNSHGISEQVLDSRPPKSVSGSLIQHFIGQEITSTEELFDPSTATLMDFRCDQSKGPHFIYLLPFSRNTALIESTIFSRSIENEDFYKSAIRNYMSNLYNCETYNIVREERGEIPMGETTPFNPNLTGIGANGGAIRPSSGYTFNFIQKQIRQINLDASFGKPLTVRSPHNLFELSMDKIFLAVLNSRPELAPDLFVNLAKSLSGDEFALFLSGEAGITTWIKVIAAMPKIPFVLEAFK